MTPGVSEDLFDFTDFASWSRALYRQKPPVARSSFLFDSAPEEPTDLLTGIVRDAFCDDVTDRFASVFGRGNPFALKALAERYGASEAQIICTTGASSAVAMVLRALVQPGDLVLAERPGFDVLEILAADSGARVEAFARTGPRYEVDLDSLREAVKARPRLIMLSNLHNPSGHVLMPAELQAVAAIAGEVGALVLVDEVYADFAEALGYPHAASLAPNLITVNSLSKVFSLFSLRFGWIIAEEGLAARISRANASREFGVSKLSHAVAALVLENPQPFVDRWRSILEPNRAVLASHVDAMKSDELIAGDIPENGCVYFPGVIGESDTRTLARAVWQAEHILVAPGEFFGEPGHIRLGFGMETAALDRGLARLHAALRARRDANVRSGTSARHA